MITLLVFSMRVVGYASLNLKLAVAARGRNVRASVVDHACSQQTVV